jgi:mRNA interferase MazF
VRRGEIYLVDFGEPVGHEQGLRRPALIMSAQPWLESQPPVAAVVPITSTPSERVTHVEVEPGASGLDMTSYVKCEDLRAVSPIRLERRLGEAGQVVVLSVETIIRRLLGL